MSDAATACPPTERGRAGLRCQGRRHRGALAAAALAGLVGWPLAAAQQAENIVYVSASSLPLTEAGGAQDITVLTRDDLARMGDLSVAETLARQAGIVVDRSGRTGGFGSLYLRGADPSHLVVLIDNVRQNDPLSSRGSAVDLNELSSGDVERIEIVRGNASVMHAGALAGLVNIVTRSSGSHASASAGAGGGGLREARAAYAAQSLRASVSHREEGDALGSTRTRAANGHWEQRINDGFGVWLAARLSDSLNRAFPDDSGGSQFAVRRGLDARHASSEQLTARAVVGGGERGSLELRADALGRAGEEAGGGVAGGLRDPAGLPALETDTRYRRRELQLLWRIPTGPAIEASVGAERQRETASLKSLIKFEPFSLPADIELDRDTTAAFVEARYRHGQWTLEGGVRREFISQGGATTQPALSVARTLGASGQLGASVSQASKPPSFYALGHPLIGNAALRTERVANRELYYATAPGTAWATRLTLFSARYRDLIDFEAGPPPRLVNRARIESDGIEWRTARLFSNAWRLQFEGTLLRVRDPDGMAALRFRPHAQWSAQLQLPLAERGELSLSTSYLGRRRDTSIPTGEQWLAARRSVDLAARIPLGVARATVGLDNLFNNRQMESIGTPSPARRLRVFVHYPML